MNTPSTEPGVSDWNARCETGVVGRLVFVQLDPELGGGIASLDQEWRRRRVVGRIDEREQAKGFLSGRISR